MSVSGHTSARDIFSTLSGCLVSAAAHQRLLGCGRLILQWSFGGSLPSILKRQRGRRGETRRGRQAAQTPSEMRQPQG